MAELAHSHHTYGEGIIQGKKAGINGEVPEQVGDRQDSSRQDEHGAGAHPDARRDDAVVLRQSPGREAIPDGFLNQERSSFVALCSPTHTLLLLQGACPKRNPSK